MCKIETLQSAYEMAKRNDGAPGVGGVTFDVLEERGLEEFLLGIRNELLSWMYLPKRNGKKERLGGEENTAASYESPQT